MLNTIITAGLAILHPSSLTEKKTGRKIPLTFKFDFEGMSVENVCHIAAKDLTTDIQNTTRINGTDSEQARANKVARMTAYETEQEKNGFVLIKANEKAKRFVATLTPEQALDAVIASGDEAAMTAMIEKMKAAMKG